MTTRHHISHADELYRGNAYKDGYSPDGGRGNLMSNLHLHKFFSATKTSAPAAAADNDGFFSTYNTLSLLSASGGNWISLMTGALVSAGSTVIDLDVPRNITVETQGATSVFIKIHGRNVYGEAMAETIKCSGGAYISGYRCFKKIDKIYCTRALATDGAIDINMGTGPRLGLPFHLQTKDQIVNATVDGKAYTSGGTGWVVIHVGASSATTITTSFGGINAYDNRGSIAFSDPAPDGSKRLAVLMEVDSTTNRKAFGPPNVSSCSGGE